MDAPQAPRDSEAPCGFSAREWIDQAPLTTLCVGLAGGIAAGLAIGAAIARDGRPAPSRDVGSLASRLGSQFLHSMEEAARSGYQAVQSQLGGRP